MFIFPANSPAGYSMLRSLRLRSSNSAYLSRTPASAGNQKKWTWSGWVKLGALQSETLLSCHDPVTVNRYIQTLDVYSGQISLFSRYFPSGTVFDSQVITTGLYRDPTAWYHVLVAFDTTQATAANRVKIYINGLTAALSGASTYPELNTDYQINSTNAHAMGKYTYSSSQFFDGLLSEINFIDGQALDPTSFGAFDPTTGVWRPKKYAGAYGTNGFYLPFTDNSALTTSSNVGLGKDFSGNGNYWATNNVSLTAGATYDSLTDVPTLTSPLVANFATLNPLNPSRSTLSNGNLTASGTTDLPTIVPDSGTWYFEIGGVSKTWTPPAAFPAAAGDYNFGQRPFSNTPTAALLNAFNLPAPTIPAGNKYFDATLYTGSGATQNVVNAGGFSPDLVWSKSRSAATDNKLTDSGRGTTKAVISNSSNAETTDANGVTSFNSSGFTLGSDTSYNNSGATYVGWQWKKGATPGFDVVTYTGTGVNMTVNHNLGVAPSLIFVKRRDGAAIDWQVYHTSLGKDQTLQLNLTAAVSSITNYWYNGVTSSVFGVNGSWAAINANGNNYVACLWAEIPGFSKFGSYQGNGSTDGPFVYLGFRPKYVMVKRTDSTSDWAIMDAARTPNNDGANHVLYADLANADTDSSAFDFVANGFKIRNTTSGDNASGGTYVFAAFAENPFKYALAR